MTIIIEVNLDTRERREIVRCSSYEASLIIEGMRSERKRGDPWVAYAKRPEVMP